MSDHEHQRDADRRDLSAFEEVRQAEGVGFSVDGLLAGCKILRTQGQHNIALVGAGRLGQAIAGSPIFAEHGINIAAVFDKDPELVGRDIGPATVFDASSLGGVVREKSIVVGVIAVPADAAREATDELVSGREKVIFNYSEALLDVTADVQVPYLEPGRRAAPARCTSTWRSSLSRRRGFAGQGGKRAARRTVSDIRTSAAEREIRRQRRQMGGAGLCPASARRPAA